MSIKQALLDSMNLELKVVKHLAAKLKPTEADYRPSAGQRTTLELLRYISYCAVVGTKYALTGKWDDAKRSTKPLTSTRSLKFRPRLIVKQPRFLTCWLHSRMPSCWKQIPHCPAATKSSSCAR